MRERIGKFEIVKLLGSGSMGEVFLARDPVLGRQVAVKTIRPNAHFTAEAQARFEREARAAGAMNHPNIVTIFDFGEDEGTHYLVMEYVEGEDLAAALRGGDYGTEELLELLAQACEGLAFAHERGVVHRDIKPANILVTRLGRRPVAKLMDFGVAHVETSELTQAGNWMGTANYMAPEYLESGRAQPASDLFAMGVVLYEILTGGRKPFSGDSPMSVLAAILRMEPAPFTAEEQAALGPGLVAVALRALAKDPADRFANADEMAAAVREAMAGGIRRGGAPARAAAPAPSEPRTLVVGRSGKGQCMSLRVALRQAEPGARILVLPGVYREALVVDKDVAIQGQGDASEVVIESPKGPALVLDAGQVSLAGLTLQGAQDDPGPVVTVVRGRVQMEDCDLDVGAGVGVLLSGTAADPVLRKCALRGRGEAAVAAAPKTVVRMEDCLVSGDFRCGVRAASGARVLLKGCRVRNTEGTGIHLLPGAQASLEGCLVSGQRAGGVEIEAEARAELTGTRVLDSGSIGVLALERGTAVLDDCELGGHALGGAHGADGASVQMRRCRVQGNLGLGVSIMDQGLMTLEACELSANQEPAALVHHGATMQMKGCKIYDNRAFGVVCAWRGRGVLEACEIFGNALTGAKVEPGGSLLLVRCDLRDGKDTGILLLEDAEVTLEECVVHRNARGGILLAKDASDPVLRGGNRLQDDLLRRTAGGDTIKVTPVKRA
ncbi:protein kinase domain-containing protein [Mesoterricola sediminis]|uniref:Protein kinase domain-containing protein n=1 Tax=Mesoterricola sediminis TaxID=2927980 RepID=A0AA48H556_9BACT|nr:protein kinase [Mesoterricola sediminis]BDU76153.1 hypothetical protein METESE_11110 [Mesoterricola sediminis]